LNALRAVKVVIGKVKTHLGFMGYANKNPIIGNSEAATHMSHILNAALMIKIFFSKSVVGLLKSNALPSSSLHNIKNYW